MSAHPRRRLLGAAVHSERGNEKEHTMSNPSYSPSSADDTPLTSDPSEGGWDDVADEAELTVDADLTVEDDLADDDLADDDLIELDEVDDDDDLDDFDDLDEDEEDDLDEELDEDELDEDEDELKEDEFADAARIEKDLADDTKELGLDLSTTSDDDGDDGSSQSLADTQPL